MKSYTDIEQSKKLVEILPLESADMSWVEKGNAKRTWYDAENRRITTKYEKKYYIPCWSLAALLDVMPDELEENHYLTVRKEGNEYCCCYEDVNGNSFTHTFSDNPIDACYEMIVKLHEEELL